jgi:prepilin-type N-terminal cleavage/methylation domain-containing protein
MGKPVHRRDGQDGFSLIEVMIAMAILSICMMAAVSMHFGTARNNTNGNIITQANMLAKTQLETLKNLDICDLPRLGAGPPCPNPVPGTVYGPYAGPGRGEIVLNKDLSSIPLISPDGQNGGIFRRYWTIENLGTDARRIIVTVEWGRFGRQRRVVISSNTKGNGV